MSQHHMIPRRHWSIYLKAVSRHFFDQPVRLSLDGPSERPISQGMLLTGLSLEGGHRPGLSLQVAQLGHPEVHFTHRIADPALLVRELDADGQLAHLMIEDRAHQRIVIAFGDEDPAPGLRHLVRPHASEQCDHPHCPLAPV